MSNYKAGRYIFTEISSQDLAWSEMIPIVHRQSEAIRDLFAGVDAVVFSGCGSALNVSLIAAPLFQMLTGVSACAISAGDAYLFPSGVIPIDRKMIAVLLSRSGKTTEILLSLDYFRSRKIPTIGVTCTANSPLAMETDLSLILTPLTEQSVATTRSLTGMILAIQLISAIVASNSAFIDELYRLPEIFTGKKEETQALGRMLGEQAVLTRYAFVGNGPFYGCAREAQLKVKEMTLLPSDAYPMLDYRHGPQSNVDTQMLLTAFVSDSARPQEISFLKDMHSLGGMILAICERADDTLRSYAQYVLELNSNLSELARIPLYMPAIQYMAYYRSLSLNLNPDEPRNLSYWVNIPR